MKKTAAIILAVFAMGVQMFAQGPDSFLLPRNARELAMGNASPVFVQHDNTFGAELSYGMWTPSINKNTLIGANVYYQIKSKLELSVDFRRNGGQPYTIMSDMGFPEGEFTPSDILAGLGVSYRLNEHLEFGVKGKFLSAKLYNENNPSAFGVDVAAHYRTAGLVAEIGAANLASPFGLAKVGASYSVAGLVASAEFDYLFCGAMMAAVGAEYTVKDIVSFRAGYHYGDAQKALPSFVSVGLGAKFSGVSINATYLLASETLGGTMMFGLGYSF